MATTGDGTTIATGVGTTAIGVGVTATGVGVIIAGTVITGATGKMPSPSRAPLSRISLAEIATFQIVVNGGASTCAPPLLCRQSAAGLSATGAFGQLSGDAKAIRLSANGSHKDGSSDC